MSLVSSLDHFENIAAEAAADRAFHIATQLVEGHGYESELEWARQLCSLELNEPLFLREAAWTILNSGFREAIVRRHFDYISLCFFDWESSSLILENSSTCVETAASAISNNRKLLAIVGVAEIVQDLGIDSVSHFLKEDALGFLQRLPFIGPITSKHLAKNLGFPFAKDDRHLVRLTNVVGFQSTQELCEYLAHKNGESVAVIDTLLWRASSLGMFSGLSLHHV